MKLTLLSKTIGTLGLITALSAAVGTGIQQAAQAQEAQVQTNYDAAACSAARGALGDFFSSFDGTIVRTENREK